MQERLGIVGGGAIACGLAATAARHGDVVLWARSDDSAERARALADKICGKLSGEANATRIKVTSDLDDLADRTFLVEAIAEDHHAKADLLERIDHELDEELADDAIIATTTSSLSIDALADHSGRPDRFLGFHVFNPVPKMQLIELAFPHAATDAVREPRDAAVHGLGKTGVEVPLIPGFVVNRLLFPYLFSAVRFHEETGLAPESIDACMTLGAGHPMGPLALLDLVGLDVAIAIAEAIDTEVPAKVARAGRRGPLGRKTGRGFYTT